MNVPFLDLKKINDRFRDDLCLAFSSVLDSGWYIKGSETALFEDKFANFCGVNSAVGVGNGLDALILSLKALNLGSDAEVLVPANTYIASILAISAAGYKPVLVEPDLGTYNIDLNLIKDSITKRTKAILPVHLYGRAVDMPALLKISNFYGLKVVEDVAQAHGAVVAGKRVGSFGDVNAFSFYPGKNLGALGDGGAVVGNNRSLIDTIRIMANYGSRVKYVNEVKGINSRLDELQAKLLSVKLSFLDADNDSRRRVAKFYLSHITNPLLTLPQDAGLDHVWHLFVVRCVERDRFKTYLDQHGIGNLIHYPVPPHLQLAYKGELGNCFRVTEKIHSEIISLPISPVMSSDEIQEVVDVVNGFE